MGRFVALSVFVAVLVVGGSVALAANLLGSPASIGKLSLTAGTIPSSQNGSVKLKKIPDFIAAVGRTGKLVGYIPREYVLPSNSVNSPVSSKLGGVAPVYARNLKILVGHMYPGIGFVPLGTSRTSEQCLPEWNVSTSAGAAVTTQPIDCPSTIENVPSIVGMYLPTAMATVSSLSLTSQIVYVHSGSVLAGYVVSVTPPADTKIPARSEIKVVSSLGANSG